MCPTTSVFQSIDTTDKDIQAKINNNIDDHNVSYAYGPCVSYVYYRSSTKFKQYNSITSSIQTFVEYSEHGYGKVDGKSKKKANERKPSSSMLFNTQYNYSGCLLMCKFVMTIGN